MPMFEGLKKKFSSFINSVSKKEEEKIEAEEELETLPAQPQEPHKTEHIQKNSEQQNVMPEREKKITETGIRKEISVPLSSNSKIPDTEDKQHSEKHSAANAKKETATAKTPDLELNVPKPGNIAQDTRISRRQEQPKVGMGTRLKGVFLREVKISAGDIEPFMEQLRISLLESDVNYDVSEKIMGEIHKELLANPIPAKEINSEIRDIIRRSILSILSNVSSKSLIDIAEEKKRRGELPLRILFIGPNGAGKTTTIAKIASLMSGKGFSCVISASDTFRAAAIEQTVHHANKLGVEVIKGKYGADPASIAFDAIAHAKAAGISVVLIDSAGRQETNKSLMEEMRKMARVANPDLKIFIGEGIAGNSLMEQVRQFNELIKLDGIILTKLDADAKGGNTISILSETEIPVLYFGIGEGYGDLMPYDPNFIIDNMLPN